VRPPLAKCASPRVPAVGDSVYLATGERLRVVEEAWHGAWRALRCGLSAVGAARPSDVVFVELRQIVRVVSVAEELEGLLP